MTMSSRNSCNSLSGVACWCPNDMWPGDWAPLVLREKKSLWVVSLACSMARQTLSVGAFSFSSSSVKSGTLLSLGPSRFSALSARVRGVRTDLVSLDGIWWGDAAGASGSWRAPGGGLASSPASGPLVRLWGLGLVAGPGWRTRQLTRQRASTPEAKIATDG